MPLRSLNEADWPGYFDRVSRACADGGVEIAALTVDGRELARAVPLRGLTYDRKGRLLEVAADGLDHLIRRPRDIRVDERDDGLAAVEVVDGDGATQVIRLNPAIPLGASGSEPGAGEAAPRGLGRDLLAGPMKPLIVNAFLRRQ